MSRAAVAARRAQRGSPLVLTGGEIQQRANVDWLTVTFAPESRDLHVARELWSVIDAWLGGSVVGNESAGRYGYAFGCEFSVVAFGSLVPVGRVDWGGDRHGGRARLDLSGSGCGRVRDWRAVRAFVGNLCDAVLTRVDLAVDCLEGEHTVDDARAWLDAGEFRSAGAGRTPRHSCPGDWFNPAYRGGEGICYGRTLEVGRRANGKMLRAYEKGRQLGDSASLWTRFEVELRNVDRDLPLDILTDSDKYFAGAYEVLERVLPVAAERIRTHQAEGEIALGELVTFTRSSYGQLVNVLRGKLDAGAVLDLICRDGLPRRLQKSSLTAFHSIGADALLTERQLQ